MKTNITFETIRQLGICDHYNKLLENGVSKEEALSKTTRFSRSSLRQTKKIVNGQTAHSKKFGGVDGLSKLMDEGE